MPTMFRHELATRARYPHKAKIEVTGHLYVVEWRSSRYSEEWHTGYGENAKIATRNIFAWIKQAKKRVGGFELNFLSAPDAMNKEAFWDWCDGISTEHVRVADLINAAWEEPIHDVMCYGPVMSIEYVWMSSEVREPNVWVTALQAVMATFKTHDYSIMVLKAFPLEYDGGARAKGVTDAQRREALNRRFKAMLRHYERQLNVVSFPGAAGRDGWMWRPHPKLPWDVIPKPKASRTAPRTR